MFNKGTFASAILVSFSIFTCGVVFAQTPSLTTVPPSEDFVGETFCFNAGFTNSGANPGYGPYYRVITQDQYTFSDADFLTLNQTIQTVGVFPASPGNQLTDPISGEIVTGDEGSTLSVVEYPIGSVVTGQPSLDLTLCIDVDPAAPIDVLVSDAFSITPAYQFGDTPTGDNGSVIGTEENYDFTPVVIRYSISDIVTETENPPGPAWEWDIEVVADIASDRTVTGIDFGVISPITLPANVQFVGPVTFTGTGVSCSSVDPSPGPGGDVELSCTSGTGTIGEGRDIVATFPVYITDTLDETSCANSGAINTAKHVTIQKTSSGANTPDGTVTYEIEFQVSEFVEGIDSLIITDVLPDGLTYINMPTLTYNGGSAVSIGTSVSNDSPGAGQTTVVYSDVTSLTGTLIPATSGRITYTTTIDQTYSSLAPVRARDELTNTVTGEYDISDGVSPPTTGASGCTDTSSETITIQDVVSSKSIVGSATVSPGDTVTWRLRLEVPSGDVQGIVFEDYFPLPIFDVSTIDVVNLDIDGTNSSISRTSPGDTFGQDPTAISIDTSENRLTINWPDANSTSGIDIEVDVDVEVSSEPFADGLVLSNVFQVITNNTEVDGSSGLNIANITLQQPDLSITKTVTSASSSLEAGDEITFDIEITNDGSALAYDVVVVDTVPAEFTSCTLGTVTGGTGSGDIFSGGYTFSTFTGTTPTALDPADSITLPVTCELDVTAENNSTYENTANVVWASQPGATSFPVQEATASVSTRQTSSFKAFVATSEAHTPETAAGSFADPLPVVAGEIIRYRGWSYLPQGTTDAVALVDFLPDGLEYVPGSAVIGLVSDSGAAITASSLSCGTGTEGRSGDESDIESLSPALDCTVTTTGSGGNPFFVLGDIVNSEDDANEELIVLEFNARVINGQATTTTFNNRFRLISGNGNTTSSNNSVVAEYLAPDIAVTKQVTPNMADADDDVDYIITFQHTTNTGDEVTAYDVSFNDVIQSGLVYDSGTGVTGPLPPAVPGTDTCTASSLVVDDSAPTTTGITITFDQLAPGDVCEVRYSATTGAGVLPGQEITNTVDIDYTSLPGSGTASNPTGSAPGTEDSLQSQASTTLTIDTVDITKSIIATSDANTTNTAADTALDPRLLSIGETVSYRLQMRLPEGSAPDYIVTDNLPSGLQYVTGTSALAFVDASGSNITSSAAITCTSGTLNVAGGAGVTPDCLVEPTGGPFASGTDLIWDLGDLTNANSNVTDEFVIIEFDALVLNDLGNQEGIQFPNSFDLSVDGSATTSTAVVAEVVEPQLSISYSHTPDPVDNRIDTTPTFSWTIVISNTGSATAFQVNTDDSAMVLPVGVENISSLVVTPTGNVYQNNTTTTVSATDFAIQTTNNTNDTLGFLSSLQIAPGASLQLQFSTELLATVEPGDTPSITESLFYSGAVTGDSSLSPSVRDDAGILTGSGNTPITSTTNLNDYRTEVLLEVETEDENPSLSVTKAVTTGPTNNGDGSFELTYTITLENTGDVNLETIALTDDLDSTFGVGTYTVEDVVVASDSGTLVEDTGYTGSGANTGLLVSASSTLPVSENGTVDIDLTVTPAANLGPLTNTADGTSISGRSGAAADNDGSAELTFDEGAEIGLAKRISAGPINNNDGTFSLTYTFVLENSGDIVLDNLQITDDLSTTFSGASYTVDSVSSSDFTVDTGYDGDSAGNNTLLTGVDSLNPLGSGSVDLEITVNPGANLGPYNNSGIAAGDPPSGNTVSDLSDNGSDPDGDLNGDPTDDSDVTGITFTQDPQIGTAKEIVGPVTNNSDGSYTLTYRILLQNVGDAPLESVQVTDNLSATFADAVSFNVDSLTSSDFAVNSVGYDGISTTGDVNLLLGTDTLQVTESGTLDLTITVMPGTDLGPYSNTASGAAASSAGAAVNDDSDDANVVDQNGNGDPSDDNDSTDVTFLESPQLGVAKALTAPPISNGDGSYSLTYEFTLENSGDVNIENLNIIEDLQSVFNASLSFSVDTVSSALLTPNPGFNGTTDTALLAGTDVLGVGTTANASLQITVTPGANLGPYLNTVVAEGVTPAGISIEDDSVEGIDPDANGNGDPSDDSSATAVTFVETALLGLAKSSTQGIPNYDGTFTTTISLFAENLGDVVINNLSIEDDIETRIAPATVESIENVTISGGLTLLEPAFNGVDFVTLTTGTEPLDVGESVTVSFDLTYRPNDNLGPFNNIATVSGESPSNPTPGTANVLDESTDGTDTDPDGNGDPTDNTTPSEIVFQPGVDGIVSITPESVPGETLNIEVNDADENFDSTVIESFDVIVTNDVTGESETLTLIETGPDTGIFAAQLLTTFDTVAGNNDDAMLNTQLNDTLTVTYEDRLTSTGGVADRTDTGLVVGFAGIEGTAWLDDDTNDNFDAGELPLEGWIIRLEQNGVLIAEVPVNSDGSYSVIDLIPGDGYELSLIHPDSEATFGVLEDISLAAEVTEIDQNLPIDPSGVFYDTVARQPISDVLATMINSNGDVLPDACLLAGQQNQITANDGMYRFDVLAGADSACLSGETYTIVFDTPAGYNAGISSLIPPLAGPLDPTGLASPLRIGSSSTAPGLTDTTDYYLSFTLETGDPDVVFNHIPLDPVGVGGFSVRLTKEVDQRTTSMGGLVSYRIAVENLTTVALPGVSVVDSLPPGFTYVEGSAQVDGDTSVPVVTGTRPVNFAGIDLQPGERRLLQYVLRVGVGVTQGEYLNTATPFIGNAQIGNSDTAEVILIADPDFEQTSVIGKVWHDRDQDGWQDTSAANDVKVQIIFKDPIAAKKTTIQHGDDSVEQTVDRLRNGVVISTIPGRYGIEDNSKSYQAVIREQYSSPVEIERILIETKEGTRLTVNSTGDLQKDHRGDKKAGLTSQDVHVEVEQVETAYGVELSVNVINLGLSEQGLPGVRLATVEGLLIETDAHGRYHIAGVDAGFMERGRNFIVKVDPSTLPKDAEFTTENPRVKRLSQGLMNRFDFGISIPEQAPPSKLVSVKLAEMFFEPDSAEVLPGYMNDLSLLAKRLERGEFIAVKIQAYVAPGDSADEAKALAERRAENLRRVLCELLGKDVNAQIETEIELISDTENDVSRLNWGQKVLKYTIDFLVAGAHADCVDEVCGDESADAAIVIEEVTSSIYPNVAELQDLGRVDLVGESVVRLNDGGMIWWTEDPAQVVPVLSIDAPSHTPVRDNQFTENLEFSVYTNYASYIDLIRIDLYLVTDTDLRSPVATLTIDTKENKRLFYNNVLELTDFDVPNASAFVYRATAIGADQREDQTKVLPIYFIDAALYEQSQGQGSSDENTVDVSTIELRTNADSVVVFVPGRDDRKFVEFSPQFSSLGTELSEEDREGLDAIIAEFPATESVDIKAVGHTSNVPIALENRKYIADNYVLSDMRAKVVTDYLIAGIGAKNVSVETKGYGPDFPIADNDTSEGRAKNRRTDISVVGGDSTPEAVHYVPRDVSQLDSLSSSKDISAPSVSDEHDEEINKENTVVERLLKRNDLVKRRIPVYGSRIRVQGNDIGEQHNVSINSESIPIDLDNKFAVEYIKPIGQHQFDLEVADPLGVEVTSALDIEVTGKYQFMVALADFTLSSHSVSGSIEPLSGDERYDEELLTEGRLAFYLKGKIKGKYLVTAQLDTREQEIGDLFSQLRKEDPESLFRRLDPDRYYPVYGDDSTTVSDVNTQGRMYLKLDWDRSELLWGNYETGFTGNELNQYSRGLYGAKAHYESLDTTEFDDSKTTLSAFVSEAQSVLGHSEFLGTGGSLYYLRHKDVLAGSDKVRVEVRDPDTNRVIENITLSREIDYEIDEIQGRIILTKPLLQTSQQTAPSLVLDGPLDGNLNILVVDYEYLADDFDTDNITAGVRGKTWLGDHLGVGITYVDEGRDTEDYQLGGVDLTLKAAADSWLKVEWSDTSATQTERMFSVDGGLSFDNLSPIGLDDREGDAVSLDVHINAADFGGSERWTTNLWAKDVDDEYSVARRDDGNNVLEYGAETILPLSESWSLGARASYYEIENQYDLTEAAVQVEGKISDRGTVQSELKNTQESRIGAEDAEALLLGMQYDHQLTDHVTAYAGGQTTLNTRGVYSNNDQLALGLNMNISKSTSGQIEVREGHRGNGLLAGLERRLNDAHTVYVTTTYSTDNTEDPLASSQNGASMLDNVGTNLAAGHRWTLTDRANLFSEMQFSRNDEFSGIGHAFGLDYGMTNGWNFGLTLQQGDLTNVQGGVIDRKAYSLSGGYHAKALRLSSKLEFREDQGDVDEEQWLTANRLDYRLSDTYRLAAKLNYSESETSEDTALDGKLIETSLGLARRPVDDGRFNWLSKYTYLYDLQSIGQLDAQADQRSHIASWEGIYRLNKTWDVGSKFARRTGEIRLTRDAGEWFESTVNFVSVRARWHVLHNWDAMAEYRWLEQEEAGNDRGGYLFTVDRHLGENFKLGVGYNFTDFSDDLTDLDYEHEGWFLNVLGKY